jgi:hypothetical protein
MKATDIRPWYGGILSWRIPCTGFSGQKRFISRLHKAFISNQRWRMTNFARTYRKCIMKSGIYVTGDFHNPLILNNNLFSSKGIIFACIIVFRYD